MLILGDLAAMSFRINGSTSHVEKDVKPIGSMYGIFTYIWLIFMVNVGIYTIHGWYGKHSGAFRHQNCNILSLRLLQLH